MMRILVITIGLLFTTGLAWGAAPSPQVLEELDAKTAVELANTWRFAGESVTSFITTEAITFVFADGQEVGVPLADEVYIAVAPYLSRTHPCATHYLSSCTAELQGVDVNVQAQTADGTTIFEGVVTSLPNGFIELWLPRNLELLLNVEVQGYRASELISTEGGARTCVTTMQLARP